MIKEIEISNEASFNNNTQTLDELKEVNYIYGPNGSGKTTISRVISRLSSIESPSTNSRLLWINNSPKDVFVYNSDFVEKNFRQSENLEGVFTIGSTDVEIEEKISNLKKESQKEQHIKEALETQREKKNQKAEKAKNKFDNTCWETKNRHEAHFKKAFTGYMASRKSFAEKVIQEAKTNNQPILDLDTLKEKSSNIFSANPEKQVPISRPDIHYLLELECSPIPSKKIIGKSDVDIDKMIKELDNIHWVEQGLPYFDKNNKVCPFCQQSTSDSFRKSLESLFDETFKRDKENLKKFVTAYEDSSSSLKNLLDAISKTTPKFLDVEAFNEKKNQFEIQCKLNEKELELKMANPSNEYVLHSTQDVLSEILDLIQHANSKIEEHNSAIDNIHTEKKLLISNIWAYLMDAELKQVAEDFIKNSNDHTESLNTINKNIREKNESIRKMNVEIESLEGQKSSIQPTITSINRWLEAYGFNNFSLQQSINGTGYTLKRLDGSCAKNTLSEGEKTFIMFLYFFHLIEGNIEGNTISSDRVVVFDDPISSLDSDILFIVSSLIKKVINQIRESTGNIKQIFILTHNPYFHKEVTYNSKRSKNNQLRDETFWVISKKEHSSVIKRHYTNPIKTGYEQLWQEYKLGNNLTIQNTMRRIIENYFTMLGGVDKDNVCSKFEGSDKIICKSLFSWINEGSHSIRDGYYMTEAPFAIEFYKRVFEGIFRQMGHGSHFEMMMGDSLTEGGEELINLNHEDIDTIGTHQNPIPL